MLKWPYIPLGMTLRARSRYRESIVPESTAALPGSVAFAVMFALLSPRRGYGGGSALSQRPVVYHTSEIKIKYIPSMSPLRGHTPSDKAE